MAMNYLKIPFKSIVLDYDDEKTPIEFTGKKMLPIIQKDQQYINESLDIIALLDKDDLLEHKKYLANSKKLNELNDFLDELSKPMHSLTMPFWVNTKEFNQTSANYFINKKSVKRGPFKELYEKRYDLMEQVSSLLKTREQYIQKFYHGDKFSLLDIVFASHIWGLYAVSEFQFSDQIHQYLQRVRNLTGFDYYQDFWL
jgi:glutaredoxin 2